MTYKCASCGEFHDDLPAFGSPMPAQYWEVPKNRIESDVFLTSDSCVIHERHFFIRGCIEIPILGRDAPWVLGAWVSLKEENFMIWQNCYYDAKRSHIGPLFGWLSSLIPCYPDTLNLKTMAYIMDNGIRPRILIEPTSHQLSLDQENGVTIDYAWKMVHDIEKISKRD